MQRQAVDIAKRDQVEDFGAARGLQGVVSTGAGDMARVHVEMGRLVAGIVVVEMPKMRAVAEVA